MMRPTFICSFIAATSLATSASASSSILDTSLVGWSEFGSSSTGASADFGTGKSNVTVSTSGNFISIQDTVDKLTGTPSTAFSSSAAFVLDLSKVSTTSSSSFQLILGYYYGSTIQYWGAGLSTDNKIQGTWDSATAAYNSGALTTETLSGKVYVILSHSTSGSTIQYQLADSTETVSVSLNGLKSTSGSNQLDKVFLSSSLVSDGAIEQLYLFNTNQSDTATEIITAMKSIPEPATSTFGLLSLCSALFFRKRR